MASLKLLSLSALLALGSARPEEHPPHRHHRKRQIDKLDSALLFPKSMSRQTVARHRRVMSTWKAPVVHYGSESISPITYGADPTGVKDSSAAFQQAVAVLLAQNTSGHVMSDNITDLGGAVIDLEGGDYLLSAPLVIPKMYGNFRIVDGTLRASQSFPTDRYVVEVGGSCPTPQGSCNENVGMSGITVDASHVAAGCILIQATMGATIDSSSAMFGFNQTGIHIYGGHEVMITETWVATYFWSQPLKEHTDTTGILIDGNDHFVTNVIVFSSRVGLWVAGSANLAVGVHTWNQATGNDGIGILNEASQNRFDSCYLDYNDMKLTNAQEVYVGDSFFLGDGQLVLAAPSAGSSVQSLTLVGNTGYAYSTGQTMVTVNETQGTWTSVSDFALLNSNMAPGGYVSATKVIKFSGSNWMATQTVDFSDVLLFPHVPIQSAMAQVVGHPATPTGNPGTPPIAYVAPLPNPASPLTVTVYAPFPAGAFDGDFELHVTADQSLHSNTFVTVATNAARY